MLRRPFHTPSTVCIWGTGWRAVQNYSPPPPPPQALLSTNIRVGEGGQLIFRQPALNFRVTRRNNFGARRAACQAAILCVCLFVTQEHTNMYVHSCINSYKPCCCQYDHPFVLESLKLTKFYNTGTTFNMHFNTKLFCVLKYVIFNWFFSFAFFPLFPFFFFFLSFSSFPLLQFH